MSIKTPLLVLCKTKNEYAVYYDPIDSHAATHFADTPDLVELVKEVLEHRDLVNDKEVITHDFRRIVGKTDLIKTVDTDTILYAKRVNRDNYTRFILNGKSTDSSQVTLILYRYDDTYTLFTAWVGIYTPSFPGTSTATDESVTFWSNHALVWGTQEIQPGTETKEQPW